MAKVIVLGAGISGHTAAQILKRKLGKGHEVTVISPNSNYQWVPSNIWVGVGKMSTEQVVFKLAPVYQKLGIGYKQALAVSIHPEGNARHPKPFVSIRHVAPDMEGKTEEVEYDYLVNSTGPKLNFAGTEGLGPDKFTNSVCTYDHAAHSWKNLQACIAKMEKGQRQTFVIGTGHPMATCQGAAFEYALNIKAELDNRKLGHLADMWWITNEAELGDFGMGGAYIRKNGYVTPTKIFTESILREYGVRWIKQAGVKKVDEKAIHYEDILGQTHQIEYDFAMLIPGFAGTGIKAYGREDQDISDKVFAANGMMKVDADYTPKPYEQWKAADWPSTYQSPAYPNVYATGIAFAPPHGMSKPAINKNGMSITPTPPRTGMPSGVMGMVVAQNIAHQVKTGKNDHPHRASMARMGAVCVVSAGYGFFKGRAAVMTVFPIVPDWEKHPKWGRDINYTIGEIGLAGHWVKLMLHYLFMYKAKARPLWWMIPE